MRNYKSMKITSKFSAKLLPFPGVSNIGSTSPQRHLLLWSVCCEQLNIYKIC